jgi:hypothetical protein
LVAVTDRHIVAQSRNSWHLLSMEDGSRRARQSRCGDAIFAVADDEHIYAECDGLVMLRLEDLAVESDEGPVVDWDVAYAADGHLIAAQVFGNDVVAALRQNSG